jgi:hypothetical protein
MIHVQEELNRYAENPLPMHKRSGQLILQIIFPYTIALIAFVRLGLRPPRTFFSKQ